MALLHSVVVCILATTCLAATHRVKRQAIFSCPSTNGTFPYQPDCAQFYQCTNNEATVMTCGNDRLYNPNTQYCDWPSDVRALNPSCTDLGQADPANAMCNAIPDGANPEEAFKVQVPELCNAFFTCARGTLFGPCNFCAVGTYFDTILRQCVSLGGADPTVVCNGNRFVTHKYMTLELLGPQCRPKVGANPFQALYELLKQKMEGGGGNTNQGGNTYNPGNNNQGGNNYNQGNNYNRGGNRGRG